MNDLVDFQSIFFAADEVVPNNPSLPVLVYRQVLDRKVADKDRIFKRHFEENGWVGCWTGVVFDYHHFHTTSHEVLAMARGHVTLALGGESGKEMDFEAGDVLILPAGTGHKMITGSENLVVVGAYPPGQENYDICRSVAECPGAAERIAQLSLPPMDPFYGAVGPLLRQWRDKSAMP